MKKLKTLITVALVSIGLISAMVSPSYAAIPVQKNDSKNSHRGTQ
jgi:energy-converting hydrogenase Eha subunit C